ncbi:hypothetical protein [Flagellimonas onchidii]|uniref:hypothetical protein n=1 Tax=Flagellimonas onchidii TaxID=2562684 RepID=UPI0010A5A9C6|nr:hypothetical protein [Allomuricauda onchidii]
MMKISKKTNGNILIMDGNDLIQHVIVSDVFLQLHPRNGKGVLISKTPTNQDECEAIVLYADRVKAIGEEPFEGNRNDLMAKLSELF